jgi:hypothetical protein
MSTSDTGAFRLRQAVADLNRQKLLFPLATVRRIGAGIGIRSAGRPDLQRRLEWHFSGKVPTPVLRRDSLVHGALLMASALPEDDFDSFLAATVLLLLERLTGDNGQDDGFWNWRRLAPHYRLAGPALRAAVMCGFREGRRTGRIALPDGPGDKDCLSAPRDAVIADLSQNRPAYPLLSLIERSVRAEVSARDAGDLWATQHHVLARLPDGPRHAALAGFRFLYERPASMEPSPGTNPPAIPGHD